MEPTNQEITDVLQQVADTLNQIRILPKQVDAALDEANIIIDVYQDTDGTWIGGEDLLGCVV